MNKTAFLIPVYNHGSTLDFVVSSLKKYNLPIILVDDGNDEANKEYIKKVREKFGASTPSTGSGTDIIVVENKKNLGKGAAVNNGVRKANELGFTHVFQLDSDGQHDTSSVPDFLAQSENAPDSVICGYPEYDESVPKSRLKGRKIANGWIHIVTLSRSIKDAMIGFRIYPVASYMKILNRHAIIDSRMGYDIDILVHLSWANVKIISRPVKISYPKDGVSNFRMFRDNVRISLTYTRLCIGMFFRFPVLLARKLHTPHTSTLPTPHSPRSDL